MFYDPEMLRDPRVLIANIQRNRKNEVIIFEKTHFWNFWLPPKRVNIFWKSVPNPDLALCCHSCPAPDA